MFSSLDHEDLKGNDILAVTNSHAKKLAKVHEDGKGITIRMSSKQLKHNTKIEGGFLGLLSGLAARALPMIAKTVLLLLGVGAISWLASSGVQKAMGSGLYLKKGGCVCRVKTDGSGLYLKPYKGKGLRCYGDGLYLKQERKLYDGKGLLLLYLHVYFGGYLVKCSLQIAVNLEKFEDIVITLTNNSKEIVTSRNTNFYVTFVT